MTPLNVKLATVTLVTISAGVTSTQSAAENIGFSLPAGFSAEVLVDSVPNARAMSIGDRGTLFVSTRRAGKVYAVSDAFTADPRVVTIADGLKMPNGVAFHAGALYVAERHRIIRFPAIEDRLDAPPEPAVIGAALPYKNPMHAWKYLAFGPDGKLYVPVGAPCNVCDQPEYGVLMRMNGDGSKREIIAHGVRNSVGFDWHPETGQLWFTDNGRDMLGDDLPAEELNRLTQAGQHFGFPFCHGGVLADPEFGSLGHCDETVGPVQALPAHAAPLGMRFYTGQMFPDEYQNQVFIAEHGSWNRSEEAGKTGYRVSLVRLEGQRPVSYEPFMEGFLDGDQVLGRPVDILIAPDGALLVSDDQRGVIYRIAYRNP